MRIRPCLLLPLAVLLGGCLSNEVGDYRLDDVVAFAATCSAGIQAQRGQVWTQAVVDEVLDDMHITRGGDGTGGVSQVQIERSFDSSLFWADLEETADYTFHGERFAEGTTVAESRVGTDYSALVEADALGCLFDLGLTVDLLFRDEAWDEVEGTVIISVDQTAVISDNRCEIGSCAVEYRIAGAHSGAIGGDRIEDDAEQE
jgi:hypothetical protein